MLSIIKDILVVTVPFVSAVVLFILSSNRDNRFRKMDSLRLRVEKFYTPFYVLCAKLMLSKNSPSELSDESRHKILDTLLDNLHYVDSRTQSLLPELYFYFIALDTAEMQPDIYSLESARKNADEIFVKVKQNIYTEYMHLCRKLELPEPTKEFF